jgi:hypothetical protein
MISRLRYLKRILSAYVFGGRSNLSFWHTPLAVNSIEDYARLGKYPMNFVEKTKFPGPFDADGVPMLDYKGNVGVQYNPNAVAQYALGHYDLFVETGKAEYREVFLRQADWFVRDLRVLENGVGLWEYKFDFEYHEGLKGPWRSALAQGQGISVVARAYEMTHDERYLEAAAKAFKAFELQIDEPGGVTCVDEKGYTWFEELIFIPPTHVLNGFIWALWGVYDYYLITQNQGAIQLYEEAVRTLQDNVGRYDIGFWTIYHLAPTRLKMVVSTYYQRLHVVQLQALFAMTGKQVFKDYADRWEAYYEKWHYRCLAVLWKVLFKLFYY